MSAIHSTQRKPKPEITRADYWCDVLCMAMSIEGGQNVTASHRLQPEARDEAEEATDFFYYPVQGLPEGFTTGGGTRLTFADGSRLAVIDATDFDGGERTIVAVLPEEKAA